MPLLPAAPPPADFRATLDAQGPLLEWDVRSIPAPSPGVTYRLRIYRRARGKTISRWPVEQPYRLGEDEARDRNFEWEQGAPPARSPP